MEVSSSDDDSRYTRNERVYTVRLRVVNEHQGDANLRPAIILTKRQRQDLRVSYANWVTDRVPIRSLKASVRSADQAGQLDCQTTSTSSVSSQCISRRITANDSIFFNVLFSARSPRGAFSPRPAYFGLINYAAREDRVNYRWASNR